MEFKLYSIKNNQIAALSKKEQENVMRYLETISYSVKVEGYQIK